MTLVFLALTGCGPSAAPITETSSSSPDNEVETVLATEVIDNAPPSEIVIKEGDMTLTFPPTWKGVHYVVDRSGYGPSEDPEEPFIYKLVGAQITYLLGTNDPLDDIDQIPMFAIMQIDRKYKGSRFIPKDQHFLWQNKKHAYYWGEVRETGTFDYIYEKRPDNIEKLMADIPAILKTTKYQD